MKRPRAILLAAENAAVPGLRRTSLGDTVCNLAAALAGEGWDATVVTPGYGLYEATEKSADATTLSVRFAGVDHAVSAFSPNVASSAAQNVVLEHPAFSPQGPGQVYCHDRPDRPFAIDATKFAFFAACAAAYIDTQRDTPDVVHAFDWQAALYFAVREFDPRYLALKGVRSVFTIHSIAVQGRRPLGLDDSSLRSWFSDLAIPRRAVVDPLYAECVNPVATALRLADAICVPSARFAKDLRRKGTQGLETVFAQVERDGRLVAIGVGGTPRKNPVRRPAWRKVRQTIEQTNRAWIAGSRHLRSTHYLAERHIDTLGTAKPRVLATLLGPFNDTQTALLAAPHGAAGSVLDALLATLQGGERLVAAGDSDAHSDAFLTAVAARQPRFLYLAGDSDVLARELINLCDFHVLAPHSAPNAARALVALNAGRPCLVHDTGALHDIVQHDRNGWRVAGGAAFGRNLVTAFAHACATRRAGGENYTRLTRAAARTGPNWRDVALTHIKLLYRGVAA